MAFKSRIPAALLVHDGELSDIGALLMELGISVGERKGLPTPGDAAAVWDLVIATPMRMLEFPVGARGARVAILTADSKTLRAMLIRAGIDLIVRRPVHPEALRLLLIYTLYSGPEKRRADRVAVGFPVRYRTGRLRRRDAILSDLSMSGCRLITEENVRIGTGITLHIPDSLVGKALALSGDVVRTGTTQVGGKQRTSLAVAFDRVEGDTATKLHAAVLAHVAGPAMVRQEWLNQPAAGADLPALKVSAATADLPALKVSAATAPAPAGALVPDAAAPPAETLHEPLAEPSAEEADEEVDEEPEGLAVIECNRRVDVRRTISRPVVAMSRHATRVLLGRDISVGGMRIDANSTLAVGERFDVAIHVRAQQAPLVVRARVDRDDGDRGLLLRFEDLTDEARACLEHLVDFLPILANRGDERENGAVVVSEILEREAS